MNTIATRYIDVTKEGKRKLMQVFDCTEKMVVLALTYRKDTELARKIRHIALKEYDAVPMVQLPEGETMHDAAGRICQRLKNGAMIVLDKNTGACSVFMGERLVRYIEEVRINEIEGIQSYAMTLR